MWIKIFGKFNFKNIKKNLVFYRIKGFMYILFGSIVIVCERGL